MNKKRKSNLTQSSKISPEEAVQFIESMWQIQADRDARTKLISLRIPENILNTLKTKAKLEQKKYQSLIVHYIREGLKNDTKK